MCAYSYYYDYNQISINQLLVKINGMCVDCCSCVWTNGGTATPFGYRNIKGRGPSYSGLHDWASHILQIHNSITFENWDKSL